MTGLWVPLCFASGEVLVRQLADFLYLSLFRFRLCGIYLFSVVGQDQEPEQWSGQVWVEQADSKIFTFSIFLHSAHARTNFWHRSGSNKNKNQLEYSSIDENIWERNTIVFNLKAVCTQQRESRKNMVSLLPYTRFICFLWFLISQMRIKYIFKYFVMWKKYLQRLI